MGKYYVNMGWLWGVTVEFLRMTSLFEGREGKCGHFYSCWRESCFTFYGSRANVRRFPIVDRRFRIFVQSFSKVDRSFLFI